MAHGSGNSLLQLVTYSRSNRCAQAFSIYWNNRKTLRVPVVYKISPLAATFCNDDHFAEASQDKTETLYV